MNASISDHLERARRGRFVGRAAERHAFRGALTARPGSFGAMFVHGPGGVGKSALLAELADVATMAGRRVVLVDGREMEPSPSGFAEALTAALGLAREIDPVDAITSEMALFVDTFEWLVPIEGWLRRSFVPALPSGTVLVIAGRRPPTPEWLADPGWRDLLHVVGLRNLSPDEVRTYADIEGVRGELVQQMVALTHGHPLALSLLVDALVRSGEHDRIPTSWIEAPDLVRALVGRIVDEAPSARELAALHVCARARTTTEAMLRAVLPGDDAAALFEWLAGQTFVTATRDGLRPHDIAREVLDADLRWRDPATHADLYRRVRRHQVEWIRHGATDPVERQRAVADAVFLVRDHPVAGGVYWDLGVLGESFVEPLRPDDEPALLELTARRQGDEQAALAAHWMARQPGAFRVFRHADGSRIGYAAYLRLDAASSADIGADPGAAAMWAYAQRYGPPRAGELVTAWRFLVDAADVPEREAHAAGTLLGMCHVSELLTRPRTAWDFVGVYTEVEHWTPFLAHYDFRRTPEADFRIGAQTYAVYGHDWRRVGVDDWLELTSDRDLGAAVDPPGVREELAVLSSEEFANAVKDALRHVEDVSRLAQNPLVRSVVVAGRIRRDGDPPGVALRRLVEDAAAVLRDDERTHELHRVLDRTFLHPAPSQEQAAELLGLSFSTYRRRRDQAVDAVVQWLWERELSSD